MKSPANKSNQNIELKIVAKSKQSYLILAVILLLIGPISTLIFYSHYNGTNGSASAAGSAQAFFILGVLLLGFIPTTFAIIESILCLVHAKKLSRRNSQIVSLLSGGILVNILILFIVLPFLCMLILANIHNIIIAILFTLAAIIPWIIAKTKKIL